jgi:hypothetical protein
MGKGNPAGEIHRRAIPTGPTALMRILMDRVKELRPLLC